MVPEFQGLDAEKGKANIAAYRQSGGDAPLAFSLNCHPSTRIALVPQGEDCANNYRCGILPAAWRGTFSGSFVLYFALPYRSFRSLRLLPRSLQPTPFYRNPLIFHLYRLYRYLEYLLDSSSSEVLSVQNGLLAMVLPVSRRCGLDTERGDCIFLRPEMYVGTI